MKKIATAFLTGIAYHSGYKLSELAWKKVPVRFPKPKEGR